MAFAIALHTLFAVIWVGGLFFAYVCLRPAAMSLEGPLRVQFYAKVLGYFFTTVLIAIPVMLGTGLFIVYGVNDSDIMHDGQHVQIMFGLGVLMMLLFLHVFFAPYRRLKRAAAAGDTDTGLKQLSTIRVLLAINLLLGVAIVLNATGGKYFYG